MTVRRLFVALFVVALFAMAVRETLDPDMWWHLRTGEYVLANGIPQQDVFSLTVPGQRWVTHEWLAQVVMWLIYTAGGLPGLMLAFAVVIVLSFWLVYRRCDGRPYFAAFVVLLAAVASALTWGARPQMFNLLLMATFIFIVEGVKEGRWEHRVFWTLPLLTALWVNLHSGYLLGVVLLGAYVVGEGVQLRFGERDARGLDWPALRVLAVATALSFLAALLNPNGVTLWIYPFETLGSSAMQRYIQEWQPPDFHLSIFWPFGVLLALGVVSWLAGRRRLALTDVLLFLGTGAAGLLSARHVPLFALVAAPVVCRYLWPWLAETGVGRGLRGGDGVRPPGRGLIVLNWLILALAVLAAGGWTATKVAANDAAIAERFPVAAVDYLEAAELAAAPGFNTYGWGGYLIWRGVKPFVDGRADVYGDPFLFYYLQTFELQENWREPLDDFDVRYALLRRGHPLTTLLAVSDDWREAYADDLAQIFVRGDVGPDLHD